MSDTAAEIFRRLSDLEAKTERTDQCLEDLEKHMTNVLCKKIEDLQKIVESRFKWTMITFISVSLTLITLMFTCVVK